VDEGVVEGGEDTGDAEDKLACAEHISVSCAYNCVVHMPNHTIADLGTKLDVLLRTALDLLLGCHGCCCAIVAML
jgi:hypothetical protein